MSTYYRERDRERERDWDVGSEHGSRQSYTVRRYKVPEKKEEDYETDIKFSRRDGGHRDSTSNVREYRYETDRDYSRDHRSTRESRDYEDYRYSRELQRAPSPPETREIRLERDIVREAPRRERDEYDVDRYTRTTEYYRDERPQPPIVIRNDAPPPIIIRDSAPAPVIIREERPTQLEVVDRTREVSTARSEVKSEHKSVQKSEVNEERSLAKRDDSPEEDYYYERRVRKIKREDDRREDEQEDNRSLRRGRSVQRSVHPRESASQYGDQRVDEDEIHYRRVEEYDGHRDSSPHHRLHLAEGAIAGLGAAALLREQGKKEGKKGGGKGRLVAGAGLGAVGAELITRYRHERSKSRSRMERDREVSRDRGRDRYDDDEEDNDRPHLGNWGKIGAVAAVGALAGYALSRNKGENRSRSRGRGRSGSRGRSRSASRAASRGRGASRGASRGRSVSRSGSADSHSAQNPTHQKKVIAGAGLATAALTGLYGHMRSKSQGGRSKSKVRQAAPAVVAGLGGAALAGLYENHKAKKERQEEEQAHSGRRHRARSSSRGADLEHTNGDLVQYGGSPIPRDDQSRRPMSRGDSGYRGSPGRGGYDEPGREAHEAAERRQAEMNRHNQEYNFGPYAEAAPPPAANYPETPYFPQQNNNNFEQHAQNAYAPPMPQFNNQPPQSQAQYEAPPPVPPNPDYYQPQQQGQQPYGADHRFGHGGTNVSRAANSYTPERAGPQDVEETPRGASPPANPTNRRRSRSVHFDNPPPADIVDSDTASAFSDTTHDHSKNAKRGDQRLVASDIDEDDEDDGDAANASKRPRRRHRRRKKSGRSTRQEESPHSGDSDDTIELPARFDRHGRKKSERGDEPSTGRLDEMFKGNGLAGRLFSKLTGGSSGTGRSSKDR